MTHDYQGLLCSELSFKLADGDQLAFEELYIRYSKKLLRYIKPFVNNSKDEAEEILQELFLKVWIHRKKVSKASNFEAYLFRMAKNELLNRYARVSRYQKLIEVRKIVTIDSETSLDKMIYSEYLEYANRIIDQLSPQRKTIFKMRTEEDMSIAEIARELNITSSAVKKQLYEARDFVKVKLSHKNGFLIPLLTFFFVL